MHTHKVDKADFSTRFPALLYLAESRQGPREVLAFALVNSTRHSSYSPVNSLAGSRQRRTTTVALEEQKWISISDRCNNHCYIPYDCKHYPINTTQREVWASAIASGRDAATMAQRSGGMTRRIGLIRCLTF